MQRGRCLFPSVHKPLDLNGHHLKSDENCELYQGVTNKAQFLGRHERIALVQKTLKSSALPSSGKAPTSGQNPASRPFLPAYTRK